MHLVIPIEASVALAKRWCDELEIKWDSMFLSKYDEAISPWGLLQASLIQKQRFHLCLVWYKFEDYDVFKIENLVEKCTGKMRTGYI